MRDKEFTVVKTSDIIMNKNFKTMLQITKDELTSGLSRNQSVNVKAYSVT